MERVSLTCDSKIPTQAFLVERVHAICVKGKNGKEDTDSGPANTSAAADSRGWLPRRRGWRRLCHCRTMPGALCGLARQKYPPRLCCFASPISPAEQQAPQSSIWSRRTFPPRCGGLYRYSTVGPPFCFHGPFPPRHAARQWVAVSLARGLRAARSFLGFLKAYCVFFAWWQSACKHAGCCQH